MRVALITTSWPDADDDPAGHFVRTDTRDRCAGDDVVVFSPRVGGAFGWPGVAARVGERPWRALEAAAWVRATRRQIVEGDFDRLVAHWAVPCGWPIATSARVSLEVVSHGGDVRLLRRIPVPVRGAIVRKICARASTWRFVSRALLDELLASLSAQDGQAVRRIARVLPTTLVLPDVRDAAARRRASYGGKHLIVCVARLVVGKRVDAIVHHVASTSPASVLVVVGDGPERARLERLARAQRVEALFVGKTRRTDALTWIAAADVLVHASRAEGLSTVVREAESLGVRVETI